MIRKQDLIGVRHEFERILENLDKDPPAALTAACALLEALFKSYIADEALAMPADESVLPLWKVVRGHLGLIPADFSDDHLKKFSADSPPQSTALQGFGRVLARHMVGT